MKKQNRVQQILENDRDALIAMSGGVDSSVAAYLIQQQGFFVRGITFKMFNHNNFSSKEEQNYLSINNIEEVKHVARDLGIPYLRVNCTRNFQKYVIEKFVFDYQNGATPNPCVDCNRYIKFPYLWNIAKERGIKHIATGHYARVEYCPETGRMLLKKAFDLSKDQSYVLYTLSQEQLTHLIFPLGIYQKSKIRTIAKKLRLNNAERHDSQDICFIPDGNYGLFIEKWIGYPPKPGYFLDQQGKILGQHKGFFRYTIGQRRGLGIALNKPMYVLSKNLGDNTITLCDDIINLLSFDLVATDLNWIAITKITKPLRVKAKIRYNQIEEWAEVFPISENKIKIVFDQPQRAIAKGQAVVLYDDDTVVGGGKII